MITRTLRKRQFLFYQQDSNILLTIKSNNPKNGSYPAHSMRSGGCQGGRGRVIFATT